jgi:hypothetical protein
LINFSHKTDHQHITTRQSEIYLVYRFQPVDKLWSKFRLPQFTLYWIKLIKMSYFVNNFYRIFDICVENGFRQRMIYPLEKLLKKWPFVCIFSDRRKCVREILFAIIVFIYHSYILVIVALMMSSSFFFFHRSVIHVKPYLFLKWLNVYSEMYV